MFYVGRNHRIRTFFLLHTHFSKKTEGGMWTRIHRVIGRVRPDAVVDVSNLTQSQLSRIRSRRPLLVSTHKSFNYRYETQTLPSTLPDGTRWLVLRVPHTRKGNTATHSTRFDGRKFEPRRYHKSPVRLRYHVSSSKKASVCSIESKASETLTTAEHAWCEMDDLVLAQLSVDYAVPLYTNDRGLGRKVEAWQGDDDSVLLTRHMRELMRHTQLTMLEWRQGQWQLA